jgi:hypothetical protein
VFDFGRSAIRRRVRKWRLNGLPNCLSEADEWLPLVCIEPASNAGARRRESRNGEYTVSAQEYGPHAEVIERQLLMSHSARPMI